MNRSNDASQTDHDAPEKNSTRMEHDEQAAGENQACDELETLRQALSEARALADENLDKYRRTLAEFSNYRKRQDRDKELSRTEITSNLLKRLLPVVDDFERALALGPDKDKEGWAAGIKLIHQKLNAFLADHKVETIQAIGEPFDPRYHSALMESHSDEYAEGYVMQEIQKGYMLDGQVLRATLVQVSLGPEDASQDA